MNLFAKRAEAKSLEAEGRLADALALYREMLAHLEERASSRDLLPYYLKIGELAQRLDDTRVAATAYRRGAERFAREGNAKTVAELCIRLLRVDPSRKDVHARFARRLLVHGHVEAARQLLIDYAQRARSENLHRMLTRMDRWPDDEVRRLLTDFLDRVIPEDRMRYRATDPRPSAAREVAGTVPPTASPGPSATPAADDLAPNASLRKDEQPPALTRPTETKPPPPLPSERPHGPGTDAPAEPSPAAERQPVRPSRPPRREPAARPLVAPAEPRGPGKRTPRPATRGWRRRIVRSGSVLGILAVLGAVAYGLAPRGALPFGIKGTGATREGERPPQLPPMAAAPAAESLLATESGTQAVDAAPSVGVPEDTAEHDAPAPSASALAAPQEVAAPADTGPVEREPPAVAVPAADTGDAPEAAVPAAEQAAATPSGGIWQLMPAGPRTPDRVVIVEDLPVLAVETFDAAAGVGFRLRQRLAPGDTLSLTVVPLDATTAGLVAVGRVRVQAEGSSTIGTKRFGRYLVTGRGRLSESEMESLLARLVELVR